MTTPLAPIRSIPAYAVIIRAVHERGPSQAGAEQQWPRTVPQRGRAQRVARRQRRELLNQDPGQQQCRQRQPEPG